jgi:hypothetical protein
VSDTTNLRRTFNTLPSVIQWSSKTNPMMMLSSEQFKMILMGVRDRLCRAKEYVSSSKVVCLSCESVSAFSLRDPRIPQVGPHHQYLQNFFDTEQRVEVLIAIYFRTRPICTLFELELFLARDREVESFEDLKLGPLMKNPAVQSFFALPPSFSQTPQISTAEVIDALQDLLCNR